MQTGISTASLFRRYDTANAVSRLCKNGIDCAEVFLESFSSYNKRYGKKINKINKGMDIHSVHTLTTQFEPQLYSVNRVAQEDSFKILEKTMQCAKIMNAKYYTFHGSALFKKLPYVLDYNKHAENTKRIIEITEKYGVTLAYENVHWCSYNKLGFFSELKKLVPNLKATLDVKQARLSGINHFDLIDEMKGDVVTVHLSDVDENGKMCLPLSKNGTIDFERLFIALKAVKFDGAFIIEAYPGDYQEEDELYESYNKIKRLANQIF